MKKLIFSFLILVIAGFAAQTHPLHAASSPPAAAVLGAEETKVLTQALSLLRIVLENINSMIASVASPIPNSAELNIGLEAIKGKLTLINATIESQALAYAERVGGTKSATLSQPVVIPPVFTVVTPPVFTKESPPLLREEAIPKEKASLATTIASKQNILWFALVLIVIAGVLLFLEWRKKREPKVATAAVQEPQKPIVPMVREDNLEGIPPDY